MDVEVERKDDGGAAAALRRQWAASPHRARPRGHRSGPLLRRPRPDPGRHGAARIRRLVEVWADRYEVLGRELTTARAHLEDHGTCVHCDVVAHERADGVRLVDENRSFVAYAPFAARYPRRNCPASCFRDGLGGATKPNYDGATPA